MILEILIGLAIAEILYLGSVWLLRDWFYTQEEYLIPFKLMALFIGAMGYLAMRSLGIWKVLISILGIIFIGLLILINYKAGKWIANEKYHRETREQEMIQEKERIEKIIDSTYQESKKKKRRRRRKHASH